MGECVMAKIRARKETGTLYFDFNYLGIRCREQTTLSDNAKNRKKLELVMKKIEAEITLGEFRYEKYFSQSHLLPKIKAKLSELNQSFTGQPTFEQFAWGYPHFVIEINYENSI
jgi:integrase